MTSSAPHQNPVSRILGLCCPIMINSVLLNYGMRIKMVKVPEQTKIVNLHKLRD
jgi:hypothetical protein